MNIWTWLNRRNQETRGLISIWTERVYFWALRLSHSLSHTSLSEYNNISALQWQRTQTDRKSNPPFYLTFHFYWAGGQAGSRRQLGKTEGKGRSVFSLSLSHLQLTSYYLPIFHLYLFYSVHVSFSQLGFAASCLNCSKFRAFNWFVYSSHLTASFPFGLIFLGLFISNLSSFL